MSIGWSTLALKFSEILVKKHFREGGQGAKGPRWTIGVDIPIVSMVVGDMLMQLGYSAIQGRDLSGK